MRQAVESHFGRFMSACDVLVLPCSLMPPFDKHIRYPTTYHAPPSAGPSSRLSAPFRFYSEWMLPCSIVTLANLPAVSAASLTIRTDMHAPTSLSHSTPPVPRWALPASCVTSLVPPTSPRATLVRRSCADVRSGGPLARRPRATQRTARRPARRRRRPARSRCAARLYRPPNQSCAATRNPLPITLPCSIQLAWRMTASQRFLACARQRMQ